MERTKQEFYVGETVHIREDVDEMPYGYMPEMRACRGKNATITLAEFSNDDWLYYIDICCGYVWHAMCFSKTESDLPEFDGGTLSDLLNLIT